MNKSILVIDTPNYCSECPLCYEERDTYRDCCSFNGYPILTSDKPDWCPLKPLPKKIDFNGAFEAGYNWCIDEIVGGKNI